MMNHLSQLLDGAIPERTAVRFGAQSLSYGDAEQLANQVANVLLTLGVQRGDRIGICLDKSAELIPIVLGILKAGACYVPMRTSDPASRLQAITTSCGLKIVFTNSHHHLLFAQSQAVLLDGSPNSATLTWHNITAASTHAPSVDYAATDLAYILHTSGSTGIPKGVMIRHSSVVNFVMWAASTFGIQPTDQVANYSSLSFDPSVFDLFVTLYAGATLWPIPEKLIPFPFQLAQFIEEKRITVWLSVSSALVRMVQHGKLEHRNWSQLRHILFGGECFPPVQLQVLMTQLPQAQFHNLYGPTETTFICTHHTLKTIPNGSVSIGRAVGENKLFLVDNNGRLAERAGELWVQGPSVMAGYWQQPHPSTAVLAPAPAITGNNAPVYRTGDQVSLDGNGCYHFLGRKDTLVKVHGFRVELETVEVALAQHPGVTEVAAIAQQGGIEAFIVGAFEVPTLREYCRVHLPYYMVPQQFQSIPSLPRMANGKLDRKQLQLTAKG